MNCRVAVITAVIALGVCATAEVYGVEASASAPELRRRDGQANGRVTGTVKLTPNCGGGCSADSTHVRGIVLGYFDGGLAARVAALEAKL